MEIRVGFPAGGPSSRVRIQFRFRDKGKITENIAERKTFLEWGNAEHDRFRMRDEIGESCAGRNLEIVFIEKLLHRFAAPWRFGTDQYTFSCTFDVASETGKRIIGTAVHGNIGNRSGQFGWGVVRSDDPPAERLRQNEKVFAA